MQRERLIKDINRIEDVLEQTANDPEHKYTYAIALAVWDILRWILTGKQLKEHEQGKVRHLQGII